MRNLSYLISAFVFLALFSCSNNKHNIKSAPQPVVEKPSIYNTETNIDTTQIKQGNVMTNETENKKDTLNKNKRYLNKENKIVKEAPKHNSPDQSEIDSIKKSKEKIKKSEY